MQDTVPGAGEVDAGAGLEADFDGVEGVADCSSQISWWVVADTRMDKPVSLAIPENTPAMKPL